MNETFKDIHARANVIASAQYLRVFLTQRKHRLYHDAWATIETYIAVSMRVLDETPFDAVKSAAVTEEIKARLDGRV
jgi:hypothetical protein